MPRAKTSPPAPGDRWTSLTSQRGFTLLEITPEGWEVQVERRRVTRDGEITTETVNRTVCTHDLPFFLSAYKKDAQ